MVVYARPPAPAPAGRFALPLPTVGSPDMSDVEDPSSPTPPTRVLLVEDDAELAARLVAFLHAHGFEAAVATDGPAALARVAAEPFDLVVLAMMLPGASGFRVVQAVRAAYDPGVPVVMTSANAAAEHREYAHLLGVNWFLAKPFADDDLLVAVRTLLLFH